MKVIRAAVLSVLFCTVLPASAKVKTEHRTAFFGEDVHIDVPRGNGSEVIFKSATSESYDMPLITAGKVVNHNISYSNTLGYLVLEDVQEQNEGTYIIKDTNNPNTERHFKLIVKDCALEQIVKYGETYYIHLSSIKGPITLEFRPSPSQLNQSETQYTTEPPPVVLYDQTGVLAEEYMKRLSVSEKRVVLHSVRMTDEGSFTVKDSEGKVKIRTCLNVRDHLYFKHLAYGDNFNMQLHLPYSSVNVVFKPKSDSRGRAIVDEGVVVTPMDPLLEGRVNVEGSHLTLKKVQVSDSGVFNVTDLAGHLVAAVYIDVAPYKLPPLTLAILALLGLVALMLLACLLSCIYKVHKRNEKNKKLTLIAQQAGKSDGEAFRQVVREAYSRFTEESLTQSMCDKPMESTEVTIKGLEVSKPGRYHTLNSDNFLEMSDSGVEFTSSGLPLDSDTDAAMTYASHKPLLNAASPPAISEGSHSEGLEATVVPDGDLSASQTPDSALSPISNPHSLAAATPDGSLRGAASPGTASRGTAESDTAKSEGGAESGEGEQKEETAQST